MENALSSSRIYNLMKSVLQISSTFSIIEFSLPSNSVFADNLIRLQGIPIESFLYFLTRATSHVPFWKFPSIS